MQLHLGLSSKFQISRKTQYCKLFSFNRKIAAAFKFVQGTQNNGTLKGSNSSGQASGLLSQWMHSTSSHDGHKHHRSQTLPIIRGKNALSNPKLLQMIDSSTACKYQIYDAQKIVIASYVVGSSNETDIIQYVDTEANIATEVSLTILDLLCLYTLNHQFPSAFFQGQADLCGSLCYEILKCCNHRSRSTQTEASALLYFFMRKNFEFNKQKSIVRSHLQVSQV
ncbi:hypothetical protein CIB84_000935 [Bambusicola thoracicus]|uniref:Uncharacterized protein n=1 Tax=Bambusicola thoracicus TaxID=9083 RepID=A0A2P4TG14_BAMTH|nr:hypothetical protein CIB84_000935 [Bambusicola thoracicus]